MANEMECVTCGGRGYTIESDDRPVVDCPDCREDDADDEVPTTDFERVDYGHESDAFTERRFDYGGEQ